MLRESIYKQTIFITNTSYNKSYFNHWSVKKKAGVVLFYSSTILNNLTHKFLQKIKKILRPYKSKSITEILAVYFKVDSFNSKIQRVVTYIKELLMSSQHFLH